MVLSFRRRAGNRKPDDTEDLMQEARLALWSRLREALDLTDAERYYHNVHRALYNHVRRMAPVHCSEKRFASAIRTVHIAPLESLDAGQSAPPFEDELIARLDADRFLESLEPAERIVLGMKLAGCSQREIAARANVGSESSVSRIMKRVREKYIACMEEPAHAN